MSDEPEVRVFDSLTAAVANSAPPPLPPYAHVSAGTPEAEPEAMKEEASEEAPPAEPVARKTAARKTTPKKATGQHVRAQAGTAEGTGKSMGPDK